MEYHIQTDKLSKIYTSFIKSKKIHALKSLTMEVPAGSIMGFLGPNGAGKTTTIKILLGMVTPTSGKAMVMGKDVADSSCREKVCFMPEIQIFESKDSVYEFLSLIAAVSKIPNSEAKKRIETILDEVGLNDTQDRKISSLSRGMKQRLLLAQALLPGPELLILDEPFSGLDPQGRVDVKNLILKYNKKKGVTVFFSSHILADVEDMCDSIGIINRGELQLLGMKEDLLGLESIEISGKNISSHGIMFLEKAGDYSLKTEKDNTLSVFCSPEKNYKKIEALFKKYGASEIKIKKHYKSLEDLFIQICGESKTPIENQCK